MSLSERWKVALSLVFVFYLLARIQPIVAQAAGAVETTNASAVPDHITLT